MNKLKFLFGGQPFRSTDFKLIQDNLLDAIRLTYGTITGELVILSGIDFDFTVEHEPGYAFIVPEGFIYDGTEICKVHIGGSFSYDSTKSVYIRLHNNQESSPRPIGGAEVNVMVERIYYMIYTDTPQPGDVLLRSLKRLLILTEASFALQRGDTPDELEAGFAPITGGGLYSFNNALSDCMIACEFSATVNSGVIAVLKEKYRPKIDTPGWYRAGNSIQALSIRTNGNVEVTGAVTTGTNVIMFKYSNSINIF